MQVLNFVVILTHPRSQVPTSCHTAIWKLYRLPSATLRSQKAHVCSCSLYATIYSDLLLVYGVGAVGSMLWETDSAHHIKLRKPWNKAFSRESLYEYEPIVVRRTLELVGELDKRVSEIVDISQWMDFYS